MSVRHFFTRSSQQPSHFQVRRAVVLLMLSATFASVVGCSTYETLKKTVGNDTSEVDSITAEAENPVPELYAAAYASAPLTAKALRDGDEIQYRDVSVGEVLQMALENSEVLRELGGTILRTPEGVRTRYTPGLQQTDPRFGTHAALSAFDAQFKGSANFSRNDRIYNNAFFAGSITLPKNWSRSFCGGAVLTHTQYDPNSPVWNVETGKEIIASHDDISGPVLTNFLRQLYHDSIAFPLATR